MDTISFFNAFCEISQNFYGAEKGMTITAQFESYARDIICNLNLEHDSPCYDLYNILKVLTYIDDHALDENVEIFLLPFPYREDVTKIKQTTKCFWYQRHAFYKNNGKGIVFPSEDRSGRGSYMLFFSQNILDDLEKRRQSGLPGYGNFPTAHCRKMRQIFEDYRRSYGEGWENVSQKDFMDYVEQKITRKVSTLSLKSLWRDFYAGEVDALPEDDDL